MIASSGTHLAALGGWRGDRLSFGSVEEAVLRPVADLGWHEQSQTAPQRRLLATPEALLVLEPVEGLLLEPPLRVRHFRWDGTEGGAREGPGEPGEADLFFGARAREDGRTTRLWRCGIDVVNGLPTFREDILPLELEWECWGVPVRSGGAWWYALHTGGLLRLADGVARRTGRWAAAVERVRDSLVAVGRACWRAGVWVDGAWRPVPGARALRMETLPKIGAVAATGEHGLVLLNPRGGALPALGGPSPRLPAGYYAGLIGLPGGLHGLTAEEQPRLVPAVL